MRDSRMHRASSHHLGVQPFVCHTHDLYQDGAS